MVITMNKTENNKRYVKVKLILSTFSHLFLLPIPANAVNKFNSLICIFYILPSESISIIIYVFKDTDLSISICIFISLTIYQYVYVYIPL